MTKGTRGNNDYTHWISRICRIGADLHEFQRNTNWMLSTYFDKLTSHRREDYIDAFARFREDIRDAKLVDLDDDDQPYLFGDPSPYSFRFDFPAHISFIPYHDEKTGKPKLAERSTFDDLVSFFYLDLTRGLAAGNLPRRCKNCGHWFVAVGGYNIQYCDRPIPGQAGKSCRSVGAHETAKRKLKEASAKEYARTYNRLRMLSFALYNRMNLFCRSLDSRFLLLLCSHSRTDTPKVEHGLRLPFCSHGIKPAVSRSAFRLTRHTFVLFPSPPFRQQFSKDFSPFINGGVFFIKVVCLIPDVRDIHKLL